MNHPAVSKRSFTQRDARWIRTIATVFVLTVLMGFLWKPRLVSETMFQDATVLVVERATKLPIDETSASFVGVDESAVEPLQVTRPFQHWYVGGFPFDGYQSVRRYREFTDEPSFLGLPTIDLLGIAFWVDLLWSFGAIGVAGRIAWNVRPGVSLWSALWTPLRRTSRTRRWDGDVRVWIGMAVVLSVVTTATFFAKHRRAIATQKLCVLTSVCTSRHPLITRLPAGMRAPWTHVTRARMKFDVSPDRVDWGQFPCLEAIVLSGSVSETTWRELGGNRRLIAMRWMDIPGVAMANLMPPHVPSLRDIALRFDDADSGGSAALDLSSLSRLHSVNVRRLPASAVAPKRLLTSSMRHLFLQVEGPVAQGWTFENRPHLETLSLTSRTRSSVVPDDVSVIRLVDLPALRILTLDASRPLDLTLQRLPRLISMSGYESQMSHDDADEDAIQPMWLKRLTMDNVPSLVQLIVAGENFDDWRLSGCNRLESLRLNRPPFASELQLRRDDELGTRDDATLWRFDRDLPYGLTRLASSLPALRRMSIHQADLRDLPLSQLKACKYLEHLTLNECLYRPTQLSDLTSLPSLTELVVSGARIDPSVYADLLAMHNRWESLMLPWRGLESIRISNQPRLRQAFVNQTLRARTIELENLPSLASRVILGPGVQRLRLVDLPQVTMVVIERPATREITMRGMTSLQTFGMSNGTVTPAMWDCLVESKGLHTLLLPGCRTPPGCLADVSKWPRLQELNLNDLPVRDSHVASWSKLTNLKRLRLDRTQLTDEGLVALGACDRLQSLSLMGLDFQTESLTPLLGLRYLLELSLDETISLPAELKEIQLDPSQWADQDSTPLGDRFRNVRSGGSPARRQAGFEVGGRRGRRGGPGRAPVRLRPARPRSP